MTESARRCAVPSVGSRGYALASSTMRVRDSVSVSLLVLFSSVRKAHIFSFGKERTHAFLYRKKSIKRTASVPLDRSCGRQRFGGGYKRRRPRSRGSRDPSTAAIFMGIMPEGAHTARALRLRARSFQSHRASARRMTESARRCAVPSVGSRGYALASSTMRVRDSVSVSLLVLFSSVRKAHIFSFGKERTHAFLCRKKSIKRTASLRLDRLCGRLRFGGGYKRRHPRSRSSRDPSIAAPFASIMPEGAHTARALRLRARTSHSQLRPARGVVACASPASTATPFEPWVCTSQQMDGSLRRKPQRLFSSFSRR